MVVVLMDAESYGKPRLHHSVGSCVKRHPQECASPPESVRREEVSVLMLVVVVVLMDLNLNLNLKQHPQAFASPQGSVRREEVSVLMTLMVVLMDAIQIYTVYYTGRVLKQMTNLTHRSVPLPPRVHGERRSQRRQLRLWLRCLLPLHIQVGFLQDFFLDFEEICSFDQNVIS